MARHGVLELNRNANKIALRAAASLIADYAITLPAALPSSTQGVQRDITGQESYFTPVAALNLSAQADTVLVSSVSSGAFNLDLDTQAANLIFASPTTGVAAKPTFRNLVVGDFGVTPPTLNQWSAPTANINLNSQRISNLAEPTASTDGATKNYVDATIQGFTVKSPARAATTANITLTGLQTIDGVVLGSNDRVLVKNQTTASQNGIYTASAAAWTRSADADAGTEIAASVYLFVSEGTVNADSGWTVTTDGAIVIGTTALNFVQFSGAGQIVSGAGLTKTGNQLDVGGTAGRIVVNADNIDLALSGVSAGTYNSLTVDTYGRVTAGTSQDFSRVFRTAFTNATLVAGILTVTHNLGQQFVSGKIYDNNNRLIYPDEFTAISATQSAIDLSSFGTLTGTWNLVIVG